jgi:hypothetical protein
MRYRSKSRWTPVVLRSPPEADLLLNKIPSGLSGFRNFAASIAVHRVGAQDVLPPSPQILRSGRLLPGRPPTIPVHGRLTNCPDQGVGELLPDSRGQRDGNVVPALPRHAEDSSAGLIQEHRRRQGGGGGRRIPSRPLDLIRGADPEGVICRHDGLHHMAHPSILSVACAVIAATTVTQAAA